MHHKYFKLFERILRDSWIVIQLRDVSALTNFDSTENVKTLTKIHICTILDSWSLSASLKNSSLSGSLSFAIFFVSTLSFHFFSLLLFIFFKLIDAYGFFKFWNLNPRSRYRQFHHSIWLCTKYLINFLYSIFVYVSLLQKRFSSWSRRSQMNLLSSEKHQWPLSKTSPLCILFIFFLSFFIFK